MTDNFTLAHEHLLDPAELDIAQLEAILSDMLTHKLDYADLYFQNYYAESWGLEEEIVKKVNYNIGRGVGVRALSGNRTGFAYADEIELDSLRRAAKAASSIAVVNGRIHSINTQRVIPLDLYESCSPLQTLTATEKVDLLHMVDREARKLDARVEQVMVSLSGTYESILVVASDGTLAADIRPLVAMKINVIAKEKGRREYGTAGGGGRFGYQYFLTNESALDYARCAVKQALINLEAIEMPAGVMPVVLGPGWPGVLLHEAVGHGLEGDFTRKKTSMYAGKIGQQVAAKVCTIIDNGTLESRRGSLNVDDEGVVTQATTLIENGILTGYMLDKFNARLLDMQTTGNARRESYSHLPYPRMTNTYMLAGKYDPQEIIASVDRGLYAVNFSGGQVDITSGKFVFSTSEAYLIERGKVTTPVKGATLIGDGSEVLNKVTMVGNNLKLDCGIGVCGKEGQSVPVGVGQPTLKVAAMTVGGTGKSC